MEAKVEKQPKNTFKLAIKIPKDKVGHTYHHVLEEFAEKVEVPGFRKGKAPLDLVEKHLKEGDINGETVNHLLREYYVQALKENKLVPVGNPRISIKKFEKDSEFEFEANFAIRPDVTLKDYRKKIKDIFAKRSEEAKKAADGEVSGEKTGIPTVNPNEIIDVISESSEMEFSDMLVEDEITNMLSRLLAQAETLGLSIEQYLSAQNKTADDLRKEYDAIARKNIQAEFALSKAIEQEGIKVEEAEIEEAINGVGDESVREKLQKGQDRWYIVSVLAKNKLISKLVKELSGKEVPEVQKEEK